MVIMPVAPAPRVQKPTERSAASAIHTAVDVLRALSANPSPQGVTELATQVGVHKSTVSRVLVTLEEDLLVERDEESKKFRLGPGIIAIAGPLLADLNERRIAYPVLQRLAEQTGETVALMLWDGNACVCVEQVPGSNLIRHTTPLGVRFATALSASVRVVLAHRDVEFARSLLATGQLALPGESDAIQEYLDTLPQTREHGVAINYRDTMLEEVGIAAPIMNHRRAVDYTLLLSAPSFRITQEMAQDLASLMRHAAQEISRRLGAPPEL